jgi:hypothetical protein
LIRPGDIIASLRTLFITTKKIKTPTSPNHNTQLADILDQFDPKYEDVPDYNKIPDKVGSAMAATSNFSPKVDCGPTDPSIAVQPLKIRIRLLRL